ncbi:hypothetical protein [Actinoplanes sp. NBRC 103695]|uniref:hypothetical protein n=1 Tax=Actinoplanes sp. NBRC 103695 TaxID=3032202 RepID=UPI0024A4CA85|nr:hypothetical protein [Actinoplanes sp. NBRC 103695]GLY97855.1 hypothetical protein Acsp02_51090 [Actinoplanes sp. NBRC 103695]
MTVRKRWFAAVAVAVAVLGTGAAAAHAAIPNSGTGLINACYNTDNGALRVIDTQIGQSCRGVEQPINWPSAGSRATSYQTPQPVLLPHAGGLGFTVLAGPVLPAGTWNTDMHIILINSTSAANTFRCGLYNGGGALLAGDAQSVPAFSYQSLTLPKLITLTQPDRINIQCLHDSDMPAGDVQVYHGEVITELISTRF